MFQFRIVDVVVQAAALLAFHCLTHDEVAYVDDVAQFAQLAAHDALLEELLGLLVQEVEAVPGTFKAQVGTHDAHVCAHNLLHLLGIL